MYAERLLRLADHLETVVAHLPRERFDMAAWAKRTTCGTVCCAVGHACDIPEFAAAGLELWWPDGGHMVGKRAEIQFGSSRECAVSLFFGITDSQVAWLFTEEEYWDDLEWKPGTDDERRVEPLDVAARIRALVAEKGAVPA